MASVLPTLETTRPIEDAPEPAQHVDDVDLTELASTKLSLPSLTEEFGSLFSAFLSKAEEEEAREREEAAAAAAEKRRQVLARQQLQQQQRSHGLPYRQITTSTNNKRVTSEDDEISSPVALSAEPGYHNNNINNQQNNFMLTLSHIGTRDITPEENTPSIILRRKPILLLPKSNPLESSTASLRSSGESTSDLSTLSGSGSKARKSVQPTINLKQLEKEKQLRLIQRPFLQSGTPSEQGGSSQEHSRANSLTNTKTENTEVKRHHTAANPAKRESAFSILKRTFTRTFTFTGMPKFDAPRQSVDCVKQSKQVDMPPQLPAVISKMNLSSRYGKSGTFLTMNKLKWKTNVYTISTTS